MADTYSNGESYRTQEGHEQSDDLEDRTDDCSRSDDGLTDSSREEANYARFKDTYYCMTIMIPDEKRSRRPWFRTT